MNLYKVYREDGKTGNILSFLNEFVICAPSVKTAREIAKSKNEGREASCYAPQVQKLGVATKYIREGIVLVGE